jgi:hypothetical protein
MYTDAETCGLSAIVNTDDVFVSFKMFIDPDDSGGKFYRSYPASTNADHANAWFATGCADINTRGFSECDDCSPSPNTVYSGDQTFRDGWNDVWVFQTETGGEMTIYVNGKRSFTRKTSCGALSLCSSQQWIGSNPAFNGLQIGNLKDNATRCDPYVDSGWWFDDYFIDYSLGGQIMLSTSSTFAAGGFYEMQHPITWSDTEITAKVNPGPSITDDVVYLYVMTTDSVTGSLDVNASGYSLTIGEESEPPVSTPTSQGSRTISGSVTFSE